MIKPNKCINCRVLTIKGSADKLNYRHLLSCVSYDVRDNCQLYYQIQQSESISEIYGEEPCDCILLDWELCDRQAEEFLQQLSQDSVPIVILVEAKNQALFTHIAQDVLIKETLTPEFLDFAVQQAIAKAQLNKQLAEAETKLQKYELGGNIPLELSESQLQAQILEQINDVVIAIDNHHCLIYYNRAALRQYKLEEGKLIRKPLQECYTYSWEKPEDERLAWEALETQGYWQGENIHCLGDGTKIFVESKVTILKDGSGNSIGMLSTIRDISDRKKAELEFHDSREKLRQSEELLRLTIENTPVGITTFDLNADFLTANQNMCQIFGYAFDEIFQKNILLLTHPDSVKISLAGIEKLIAGTEKSIRVEKQYIHKSGRIIDAISRVSLVKDAEENPLHFVASVEDITEQKRIVIAQKQQMDRQEFLMNITQQIRQSLNLEQVLETAVNEVKRLLNSDRTVIYQLFENGVTKVVNEAVEPNYPAILNQNYWLDEHFTKEVVKYYINSNVRIVVDVFQDEFAKCLNEFMLEAQIKSKVVVPIVHHINPHDLNQESPQTYRWQKGNSQLWGLLIVHSCEKIRQWQPEEVELLQQLASQLAIAIQQANLYKQVQDDLLENKRLNLIVNNELIQKKVLLREIHHRVKNNLQVMSSILYLQFRHTPPEIKLLSQEYQNRIYSMALIHDQLHGGDDLSQIDFDIYITNLATNLFQCYGTNRELIQLEVYVNDIFLTLDLSIPLGLIINELISNALKYAFPDLYGKIRIQLLGTAQSLILTVSDNGVGIPDSFDLKNARSTGMQLIQSLTEQLEGEFNYYVENGSTFQITVPLP